MKRLLNEEQPSCQLNKKVCHSGGLMYTPAEIILYITDFTEYFDGANVLKQVNKHLHKINRVRVAPNSSRSFQTLAKYKD
jgi:hypothetical protein